MLDCHKPEAFDFWSMRVNEILFWQRTCLELLSRIRGICWLKPCHFRLNLSLLKSNSYTHDSSFIHLLESLLVKCVRVLLVWSNHFTTLNALSLSMNLYSHWIETLRNGLTSKILHRFEPWTLEKSISNLAPLPNTKLILTLRFGPCLRLSLIFLYLVTDSLS